MIDTGDRGTHVPGTAGQGAEALAGQLMPITGPRLAASPNTEPVRLPLKVPIPHTVQAFPRE